MGQFTAHVLRQMRNIFGQLSRERFKENDDCHEQKRSSSPPQLRFTQSQPFSPDSHSTQKTAEAAQILSVSQTLYLSNIRQKEFCRPRHSSHFYLQHLVLPATAQTRHMHKPLVYRNTLAHVAPAPTYGSRLPTRTVGARAFTPDPRTKSPVFWSDLVKYFINLNPLIL